MAHTKALRFKLPLGLSALASAIGLAAFTAHCSLTASPGDYTSGLRAPPEVPAGQARRVVVIAGERDRLDPGELTTIATSDVWVANLDGYGSITGWTAAPSAPFTGYARQAVVQGGNVYVIAKPQVVGEIDNKPRLQQRGVAWIAATDQGLGPAWTGTAVDIPTYRDQGLVLLPGGLLTLGGTNLFVADASFVSSYYPDVGFMPFDESAKTFGKRATVQKLPKGRSGIVPVVYKKFLYAVGGVSDDALSGSPSVEVATIGNGLEPFAATTAMQDPATQKPRNVKDFTACAGEGTLYVIGGESIGTSDAVMTARIDENNGQLSNWQGTATLPGGRADAGCFIARGRLYVLGGRGKTGRLAEVLSAKILPDGTLEPWDSKPHEPLPAPRSQIAVATY
ncbi:hypothetical protein [Pendulispora albinea]|uniref:Uncharacterized protein n=1 Tax=Pendulispora albinea TaxID=2741071 RepID=A0ABZ2M641_9BACT